MVEEHEVYDRVAEGVGVRELEGGVQVSVGFRPRLVTAVAAVVAATVSIVGIDGRLAIARGLDGVRLEHGALERLIGHPHVSAVAPLRAPTVHDAVRPATVVVADAGHGVGRVNTALLQRHAAAPVHGVSRVLHEVVVQRRADDNDAPLGKLTLDRVAVGRIHPVETPDAEVCCIRGSRIEALVIKIRLDRQTRTPARHQQVHGRRDVRAAAAVEVVLGQQRVVQVARAGLPFGGHRGPSVGLGRRERRPRIPRRPGRARSQLPLVSHWRHVGRQVRLVRQLHVGVRRVWVDGLRPALHFLGRRLHGPQAERCRRTVLTSASTASTAAASSGAAHVTRDAQGAHQNARNQPRPRLATHCRFLL